MEKILEGSLAGFEVPDLLAFLGQGGRTGVRRSHVCLEIDASGIRASEVVVDSDV